MIYNAPPPSPRWDLDSSIPFPIPFLKVSIPQVPLRDNARPNLITQRGIKIQTPNTSSLPHLGFPLFVLPTVKEETSSFCSVALLRQKPNSRMASITPRNGRSQNPGSTSGPSALKDDSPNPTLAECDSELEEVTPECRRASESRATEDGGSQCPVGGNLEPLFDGVVEAGEGEGEESGDNAGVPEGNEKSPEGSK